MTKTLNESYYTLHQIIMLRQHSDRIRSPFTDRAYQALTEEGERQFVAADAKNADRLKAIDDFVASSVYQNELLPYMQNAR